MVVKLSIISEECGKIEPSMKKENISKKTVPVKPSGGERLRLFRIPFQPEMIYPASFHR